MEAEDQEITTASGFNLSAEEQRVLGSLIEKKLVTPENYPLSVNSLMLACNQKTARHPVVNYDEKSVTLFAESLRLKGLVGTVTGAGSRVVKYRHAFLSVFEVSDAELTVIGLLLLRGPLTPGEIKNMSGRMHAFNSLDEVSGALNALATREKPLTVVLPKHAGQKEARYAHTLAPFAIDATSEAEVPAVSGYASQLEERVAKLECELVELKEKLKDLLG